MSRGFTLLELMITIAVMSMLMLWMMPNVDSLTNNVKMRRLAKELNGFVLMAKSEAVMRREPLWIHLIMSGTSDSRGEWRLELTNSSEEGEGTLYSLLSGKPFNGLTITTNYTSNQISFDHTHGRPKGGRFIFYPRNNPLSELNLITYFRSAIVRVCSSHQSLYLDYEAC